MKIVIISFIISLLTLPLKGQYAYSDAFLIENLISGNTHNDSSLILGDKDEIYVILSNYVDSETLTPSIIRDAFKNNPFMKFEDSETHSNLKNSDFSKSALSTIGGLDVTTIVRGLSQFMIERSKQELTIAFFNRFKKFVKENPEIQALFPKTTDVLSKLLAYNYPEMLPVLRTSFHDDLNALPYHLDDILQLPRYQKLLEELPEVRVAIKSIRLVHKLQLGETHPAEIINGFAEFEEWNEDSASHELKNMGNAIALGSIFSQGLRYSNHSISEKKDTRLVDTVQTIKFGEKKLENDTILKVYSRTDSQVKVFFEGKDIFYEPDVHAEANKGTRLPFNKNTDGFKTEVVKLDSKKNATKAEIIETKTVKTNWVVENNQTYEVTELTVETKTKWLAHNKDTILTETESKSSNTRKKVGGKSTRAWVSLEQLEDLIRDKTAFQIFLGLLYQNVKSHSDSGVNFIVSDSTIHFVDVMKNNRENLYLFQNQFTEFIELAERVEKAKNDILAISSSNEKPNHDQLFEYINTSIDVIEYSFGIASLFNGDLKIEGYVNLARKSTELFKHIYQKKYASAIYESVNILETTIRIIERNSFRTISKSEISSVLSDLSDVKKKKEKKILKAIEKDSFEKIKTNNNAHELIDLIKDKIDSDVTLSLDEKEKLRSAIAHIRLAWLREVLPEISKYGTFMANMVSAENPDEVQAVLENVVLPVGSSSIKKNAKFNIAVQSYLGAYIAPSGLGNNPTDETMAWNQPFGVTAPIGFSFSYGLPKKWGSISAFISLFDIGAIVDYDLQTDSTNTSSANMGTTTTKEYKIELGQIFSPGIYGVYGMGGNVPLSLSFGAQYGPGIFDINNSTGVQVNQNPYWRLSMTITVDIPLFNIYNKPKDFRTFE